MRTRFLRGNTAENNGLTLANGELSVDLERKAVRLHDGSTLGGFEMMGVVAVPPPPGPTGIVSGDTNFGFYGEVPNTEFITYGDLSTNVGISQGNLINDVESTWLKYSFEGKTLYIAKKPAREKLSWNALNNVGIFNWTPTVSIGGMLFKVGYLHIEYPTRPSTDNSAGLLAHSYSGHDNALLASYTEAELQITTYTWIKTYASSWFAWKYDTFGSSSSSSSTYYGWRPVLELVQ